VKVKSDIVNHASHELSKFQYVHSSNLDTLEANVMSGVLKNVFILCENGTKANIGGAKMANNRHAVGREPVSTSCNLWMKEFGDRKNTVYTQGTSSLTMEAQKLYGGCISHHCKSVELGPGMLYRIQMWAHAWSWKRSHGFTLKIGGYCP
jgi:hypothetical protein